MSKAYQPENRFREGQRVFVGDIEEYEIEETGEIVDVTDEKVIVHFLMEDIHIPYDRSDAREALADGRWSTDGRWV